MPEPSRTTSSEPAASPATTSAGDAGPAGCAAGSPLDDALDDALDDMPDDTATAAMGHGVKQRALVRMTADEVDAFLHERRPLTLCTLNHDGSVHAVAMWYGFLDGCVAIETKAKSQKAVNLRRDPRVTCLMEDGDAYEELRGVELVGRAELVDDPDQRFALGVDLFERYYGSYGEELRPFIETMLHKRVVAKVHVERTVSWDHRKLGLPPTRPADGAGS